MDDVNRCKVMIGPSCESVFIARVHPQSGHRGKEHTSTDGKAAIIIMHPTQMGAATDVSRRGTATPTAQ